MRRVGVFHMCAGARGIRRSYGGNDAQDKDFRWFLESYRSFSER